MFLFKTKEQKTIDKMKKTKQEIDKLKEEMDKMAKLVLKDGKLQKIENTPKVEQHIEEPDGFGPPLPPQAPRMPMPPQYPTQEEVNVLRQRMIQREQQIQQEYQQPVQQQVYRQPVQQQIETVTLTIEMINGTVFKYNVAVTALKELTTGLDEAINNKIVFPLNDRVINTTHIISYYIE